MDTATQPPAAPQPMNAPTGNRPLHEVTCSNCQKVTQVPFKPDPSRPVFCDDCFKQQRARGPGGPGGPRGGAGGPRGGGGRPGGGFRPGDRQPSRRFSRHDYPGYSGPYK